jgi:cytochrome c2
MKNLILPLIALFVFSCNSTDKKATVTTTSSKPDGEFLFKNNCASCHKADKDFTGPALKGAKDRWADKSLLYDFVRDPATVISNDKYARALQQKYGSLMTASPQLTNADIDAILDYCNSYTQ